MNVLEKLKPNESKHLINKYTSIFKYEINILPFLNMKCAQEHYKANENC